MVAEHVDADEDLARAARAFVRLSDSLDSTRFGDLLTMAQDRAAIICAGDPRPTVESLFDDGELVEPRGSALLGYLLSDEHLSLRNALGYHGAVSVPTAIPEIELDGDVEIEEIE